jgi:uncharacterized phage protein gp47/JayE
MDALYADGIPQPADVANVQAFIDSVRPAGAVVVVAAPIAFPIDVTISNLVTDTPATRNAIAVEIANLMLRAQVSTLTDPVTFYRSQLIEAISAATGEAHHTLAAPSADVAVPTGRIPKLGTLTIS